MFFSRSLSTRGAVSSWLCFFFSFLSRIWRETYLVSIIVIISARAMMNAYQGGAIAIQSDQNHSKANGKEDQNDRANDFFFIHVVNGMIRGDWYVCSM